MRIQGWGWAVWLAGAIAAAGLLTASAGADPPSYGAGASKGCQSTPVQVGQDFSCFYVFSNTVSTSQDTVIVVQAFDSANRRPTPATGPTTDILPQLQLIAGQTGGGALPTCTGGTGLGTTASPYVGVSSCTVPFGGTLTSNPFDLGTVTTQDVQAADHKIHDQITFVWNDTCTDDPFGTCNPEGNLAQAPASVHVVAVSALTTDVNPPDGRVPLPVNDVAHLSGVTSDAGGTIEFKLFDITAIGGTTCTNTPLNTFDVPVHGPGDYSSPSVTINKVASYGWIATYSGDANNTPAGPTACGDVREHAILDKSQTGIDTTASAASPANGVPANVSDTARLTLTAGTGSIPVTGTVTFRLYSDTNCLVEVAGSPVTATVNGTLTSGGQLFVPSPQIQLHTPGTYFWRAAYSGDANNSPAPIINNQPGLTACGANNESVTVGKNSSSLTTTASSATSLPANLTDTAHLTITPANPNAGGTITFRLYSNNTCTALVGSNSVNVSGGGDYTSGPIQVTSSGSYFWTAQYSGDASTAGFGPTGCGDPGEVSQVGASGKIELCKAPDNGAAGSTFTFTLTNLTSGQTKTVQVVGGTCSNGISILTGRWLVTEDTSSGVWNVSGIQVVPDAYFLSSGGASVKVRIVKNDETQVIFTNTPAPSVLKVCKYSSNPAIQGRQFNFVVSGGGTQNLQATAGTSLATAGCSQPLTVENGANLTVAESVPANEQVTNITVGTKSTKLTSAANGTAKITIGPGVNVLYFDNEPTGPAQTGYVEVCKDAGDAFISTTDPFTFTVTDSTNNPLTVNVLAGQCSQALTVQAGNVTIAEAPTAGTALTSVTALPSSALGVVNLINGTAIVNVPVAPTTNGEVEVHFVNSTPTSQLKVCKVLGPGSGDLAGQTFTFKVTDDAFPQGTSYTVQVIASADGACKIVTANNVNVPFPTGSTATVTETGSAYVNGDNSGVNQPDVQTVKIGTGINEVDFTNQAFGQLEVCKDVTDTSFNGLPFSFSYQGTGPANKGVKGSFTVAAGACSQPQVVPVGNYTITETLPTGFSLAGVTATGPSQSDNRVVSSDLAGGSATVSVPFYGLPFPNGGETDVHFLNSPQAASVKVCKQVENGAQAQYANTQFTIALRNLTAGTPVGQKNVKPPYPSPDGTFPAGPSSCVVFDGLAIIGTNGKPIKYQVQESAGVAFSVVKITSSNTNPTMNQPADPTKFNFTLNPGENVIIYDNTTPAVGQ